MPVVVFCLFFVFQEISTKRSQNVTKKFDDFFSGHEASGGIQKAKKVTTSHQGTPEGGGRRALVPCGPTFAPFDLIPPL